jgi:methyl-accepting chemotaxis protein
MSLSSLSRAVLALLVAAGSVIAAGLTRLVAGPNVEPWATVLELLAAGLALGFGVLSLRRLSRDIDQAAAVCAQAAQGNLEVRTPAIRNGGGLGLLQKSINDMLDIVDAYVRESAAAMEHASRGKRFRQVLVRGLPKAFRAGATVINAGIDAMDRDVRNLAGVARTFGSSMDVVATKLNDAACELESNAGSMAEAAEETSRQSSAVAAASEQASVNVQTVASSAGQLSASIAEISRQVARSATSTTQAVTDAEKANAQIGMLAEAAQRIGDVVDLINEIAGQTDLLALNATIEAARAGEAGKGFAVVAAEVKNLSNQTSKATDEIRAKIGEIQAATTQSVEAMLTVGRTISEISQVSAAIASAVEQQGAATKEIARNVQHASAGTQEVSSNVGGINQAATDTGLIATRVNGTSQRIIDEVNTLRAEVERFLVSMKAA